MVDGALAEDFEGVAAFEGADESAVAVFLSDLHQIAGHPFEGIGVEAHVGDFLFAGGVEAGAEEQELGFELVEAGDDFLGEGLAIGGVLAVGVEGDVEGETLAAADAGFGFEAGAGVTATGVLVEADVEHIVAVFEGVLGAVAVVDVKIDDGDAGEVVAADEMLGGDGDVVENAEPHGLIALGMVAGGADGAKGAIHRAGHGRITGGEDSADGQAGDVVAAGADARVHGADERHAFVAEHADQVHVRGFVDQCDGLGIGGDERERLHLIQQPRVFEGVDDDFEAIRLLDMRFAGVVEQEVVGIDPAEAHVKVSAGGFRGRNLPLPDRLRLFRRTIHPGGARCVWADCVLGVPGEATPWRRPD